MIAYHDPHVRRIAADASALIAGDAVDASDLLARLCELARTNSPAAAAYWQSVGREQGVPDRAFKGEPPYFFPDAPPELVFETSGTSGGNRGCAGYSPLGAELLRATILAGAQRNVVAGLDRPAIVRLVPTLAQAPGMVMAHGMELIATRFGDPEGSGSVIGPGGVDGEALDHLLRRAIAGDQPIVLIGGSFAFVNLCERMQQLGRRWALPRGSRVVDAGGFKGRSRTMDVESLRALMAEVFGLDARDSAAFTNIFGMTELASQLYDAEDRPLGPIGERPKEVRPFAWPRLRDPLTMELATSGKGLLEVVDLCILDRPCIVLTGDLAVGDGEGIALAGRASSAGSRGCSLTLDAMTTTNSAGAAHA